jgi:WXG100 family type VII secretion target
MATLHMEVETARSTQNTINNSHAQLTSLVQSMNSSVNGLQAAWQGNSATEFFGEYEQYRSAMNQMMEALNVLNTRLGNEITEWEAMSSKLA